MNIFCVTVRFFVWQCVFFVHHCHVYDISYTRKIVSFYQTKQIMGATTSQGRLLLEIDHLFYLKVKKTKEAIFYGWGSFFYRNGYSSQMTLRVPCRWWYWLHVVMVIVNVYCLWLSITRWHANRWGVISWLKLGSELVPRWSESEVGRHVLHNSHVCVTLLHLKIAVIGLGWI